MNCRWRQWLSYTVYSLPLLLVNCRRLWKLICVSVLLATAVRVQCFIGVTASSKSWSPACRRARPAVGPLNGWLDWAVERLGYSTTFSYQHYRSLLSCVSCDKFNTTMKTCILIARLRYYAVACSVLSYRDGLEDTALLLLHLRRGLKQFYEIVYIDFRNHIWNDRNDLSYKCSLVSCKMNSEVLHAICHWKLEIGSYFTFPVTQSSVQTQDLLKIRWRILIMCVYKIS